MRVHEHIGPTPNGGDRSLAYGFDATGAPVDDLSEAVYVVIEEYAGKQFILRTRMGHHIDSAGDAKQMTYAPGAGSEGTDPWNSEQTKGTWDVRRASDQKPVDNLEDLYTALELDYLDAVAKRNWLANFITLPSFAAAPSRLKAEAFAEFDG